MVVLWWKRHLECSVKLMDKDELLLDSMKLVTQDYQITAVCFKCHNLHISFSKGNPMNCACNQNQRGGFCESNLISIVPSFSYMACSKPVNHACVYKFALEEVFL